MTEAFDRPLTDDERGLIAALATRVLADQLGVPFDDARAALERHAANGDVSLRGDSRDVRLELRGQTLVTCSRDWLGFHAANPGYDPMRDERRSTD
jgi:hypothetical protein